MNVLIRLRRTFDTPGGRFARHYGEMLIAMVLGMVVLGMPAVAALNAAGMSSAELSAEAPALVLAGMAATMTVPMVAWMRFRGHGRPASLEMAASMVLPGAAVIVLLAAGIVTDIGTLLVIEHVAMLPSMLVAMLARRSEYTGHHRHTGPQVATA